MNQGKRLCLWRLALLLAAVVPMLVGCGGYQDIDKRAFVVSLGIDEGREGKVKVLLKIGHPASDPKQPDQEFSLLQYEAESVSEAVEKLKSHTSKELDFSHMNNIVLGEEAAKRGFQDTMDWMHRRRDIQKMAWVAVGRPDAATILAKKLKGERLPGNYLFLTFTETGNESPAVVPKYLYIFYREQRERGITTTLPIIEAGSDQLIVEKLGLVKDNALQTVLDFEQAKYLHVMLGRVKKMNITVREGGKIYVAALDQISSRYTIKQRLSGKPVVDALVKATGFLEEKHAAAELDEAAQQRLQELINRTFSERLERILKEAQRRGMDPVGFGLRYRAMHADEQEWEEWKGSYPDAEINVEVDVTLEGSGVID